MHRAGIFKSSKLTSALNIAGIPLLAFYAFAMFAWPWANNHWSWQEVQLVWDRWQSLNAATLAFAASLVAFNISRYNENLQREREFIAAKAFLPSTLSGLMGYFGESATILQAFWDAHGRTAVTLPCPSLPLDYREVFSNCIRHADPAVGTYLSNILVELQVHDARMRESLAPSGTRRATVLVRDNQISYMYSLAKLHALTGQLFPFARGTESFNAQNLVWEDFRNSYGILQLLVENFSIDEHRNLQAFTKRAIARSPELPLPFWTKIWRRVIH